MFENLRKDFAVHGRSLRERTFWAMVTYRFGRWSKNRRFRISRWLTGKMYGALRLVSEILTGIVMDRDVTIGDRFHLIHPDQVQFHPSVKFGDRCGVMHGVTVGTNMGSGAPVIGDDVFIGVGACVLGDIKIGNRVYIAANSLVITDVPDDCTAIGVPAKIMPNFRNLLTAARQGGTKAPDEKAEGSGGREREESANVRS
jgi:serine O-acetyltransferase